MKHINEIIYEYSLEEIMGDSFGRYSKYIIQDRAIPDIRDGLKPVQRRILYSMYKNRNFFNGKHVKSARAVGDVMGKYHPHGDSSIYDALIRLSQNWKMLHPMIDMQGNNGSIDGDSPAASRYTETRLSGIAEELLNDLEKNTVSFSPTYDDVLLEPTVLPAKFPNLLVNGTMGISAGYATNIPPHNLKEVIDAAILVLDKENCLVEDIMKIVKGPDFPTGAIVMDKSGIKSAFSTGKGKVMVKVKHTIEKLKNMSQIVITQIPYEINKPNLVSKIDDIRINKKIDGILEVRDETDREGLRIVIDIRKDADSNLILKYLLKNTDMMVSYNYNMVAIVDRRPKLLNIKQILSAYIKHTKEIYTRKIKFDLEVAKKQYHITSGLIKALSILDEVIIVIRSSKNKTDAKENLIKKFGFTEVQAEAIVTLQLYKLTNTDIIELEEKNKKLIILIDILTKILGDEKLLKNEIKKELKRISKEYGVDRKTAIEEEYEEIKIDIEETIAKENFILVVSKDGYVKRVSKKSYMASNDNGLKDTDYIIFEKEISTLDTILMFTDMGNYLYLKGYEIPEFKYKEIGKHVNNIVQMNKEENIISAFVFEKLDETPITMFTKLGMTKRCLLKNFEVQRNSKTIKCINLKGEDKLLKVFDKNENDVFIATKNGYGLWYNIDEISIIGLKTAGVKAINLKEDEIVSATTFNEDIDYLTLVTNTGNIKNMKLSILEKTTRAKKGSLIIKEIKSNPSKILEIFATNKNDNIIFKTIEDEITIIIKDIKTYDRYSNGTNITKEKIISMTLNKNNE
ncbi:MAG: DNA topoisomerase IV subunit A [Bacilli bacterium]